MSVKIVPALSDNYIYLIEGKDGTICIDPGQAKPVFDALTSDLIAIFNTHYHSDHTSGNQELKKTYHCQLIAPDDKRIPDVDMIASENKPLLIGGLTFDVLSTPGHTCPHVSYYCKALKAVFTGDCLFTCGCGRLFEGTAEDMASSLQKLSQLPDDTKVYGGHNYLKKNIEFALSLEPDNEKLKERFHAKAPWTLAEEKLFNPFLRVASDPDKLAKLRALKDRF